MDLFRLLEFGPAVVAVVGLIYVSRMLGGIIKNHIGDATKANQKLADMIERMLNFLERTGGK